MHRLSKRRASRGRICFPDYPDRLRAFSLNLNSVWKA
jgi:hypothetical protein